MLLSEHVCCVVVSFKVTEWVEQQICIKFWIKLECSSTETLLMTQKATAMGNCWLAASPWQCARSCIMSHAVFWQNINDTGNSAPLKPSLEPCNFWLFPKLKSPLKGKRFQTINEIQENTMGQPMAIGRTVKSQSPYFEGDWGIIVLRTMFLVSCIFFN